MPEQTTHPSPDELSAFSLGQLPPDSAQQIEEHISHCDPCCETIANLISDDTFVDLLQEAEAATHSPGDTAEDVSGRLVADSVPAPLLKHSRYQVEQLVGRGGMGRVYKARHRMMDRTVALKVIHHEWVRRQEAIDRFRREVKTAASLDHRNIVTAHDAEQADDLHFLVMEFVDGVDLAQTVRQNGPLPVSDACNYICQAAHGLQYAHERGMVHRDIKPHNLMVTQDNVVKILDFGLASLAPQATPDEPISEDADGNLTVAGAIMGTPDFISPEQAQDAHRVDGRSDIYSLGMTLYYLLAGRAPFGDGSATEKLKQHAESEPASLTTIRYDIPSGLLDVVAKMTAKNPADRFQSPKDVASALKPFVVTTSDTDSGSTRPSASQTATGNPGWRRMAIRGGILLPVLITILLLPQAIRLFSASQRPKDEVHGPLSDLDSYIRSMMASPHDLVFLNIGDIGPDNNYLTFRPVEGGVSLRFPAFNSSRISRRQGKYADRLKSAAESVSLQAVEKTEVRQDGSIDGVNFIFDVTGDPKTVSAKVMSLVMQTFTVTASEECEYTYQNLPSESSTVTGESPKQASADEFMKEHSRGERVYFGEVNNWIYLIPRHRRMEKKLQRDKDVWYANVNELPNEFVARIRSEQTGAAASAQAQPASIVRPELKLEQKTVSGGTPGLPQVRKWKFRGHGVGDLKVRLWLAQNGKADVVQEFDFEELPRDFTSELRLDIRDPAGADHGRNVNAMLYVEMPTDSRCRTTSEDKGVSTEIEAPFSNTMEQPGLKQVDAGQSELLFARSYWKGDWSHGTSMKDMTEATSSGAAIFLFVTVEWQAATDNKVVESTSELTPDEAAKIPGTPATNPAGFLMAQISNKHGDLVNNLKMLISEAAGIPNDQWESFARSPTASMDSIRGEPLSLVLLKLNPIKASQTNKDVLKDFHLIGNRMPQARDFHKAMAFSKVRGFYSMLQPGYMKGPVFQVHPNPDAKGGRITGSVPFHSGTLYAGQVNYVVNVNADYDMTVTEFRLPNYGITIRRESDGVWETVKQIALLEEARSTVVGSWRSVRSVTGGRELPPEIVNSIRIDFTNDRYTMTVPGTGRFATNPWADCTWEMNKNENGWAIKMKGEDDFTFYGLIEFDGEDRLRMCLSNPDAAPPAELLSRPGSPYSLDVLERVSKTPLKPGGMKPRSVPKPGVMFRIAIDGQSLSEEAMHDFFSQNMTPLAMDMLLHRFDWSPAGPHPYAVVDFGDPLKDSLLIDGHLKPGPGQRPLKATWREGNGRLLHRQRQSPPLRSTSDVLRLLHSFYWNDGRIESLVAWKDVRPTTPEFQ